MTASDRRRQWLVALALLIGCGDSAPPVDTAPESDSDAPNDVELAPSTPAPPPGAFESPGLSDWRPRQRMGWPVQSVHITSSFGWRVDPVSGRGVRLHRGLDVRGAIGDLVLSIGEGRVEFVGHDPLLGNMIVIDHGDGVQSLYGHLSDVLVVADVRVDRGAAIGLVGNTGRSAAPHLHLTVKLDGHAIDPLEVIGEPRHRPVALATPADAPVGDLGLEEPSGDDSPVPMPPPDAQPETPLGPVPPRHPLPHRSDDGGEP